MAPTTTSAMTKNTYNNSVMSKKQQQQQQRQTNTVVLTMRNKFKLILTLAIIFSLDIAHAFQIPNSNQWSTSTLTRTNSPHSTITFPHSPPRIIQTQLNAKSKKKKKPSNSPIISTNRQARRNYEVVSTFNAGISLLGSEIKSIRDGKMNLRDGFVRPDKLGRGMSLYNVHIGKHTTAEYFNHEERRVRPLLLTKEECRKLRKEVEIKGMTIVPLKAYFNDRNKVKVEIGLCRGKNVRDKRNDIKEREAKRDADRMVKSFRM